MRGITVAALFVLCGAATLGAQDLEYTSTTQFKGSAALGPMAAGGMRGVAMHVYLKGSRLRLDFGTVSTVVDAQHDRILMIDNSRKVYSTLPFKQPAQPAADSLARTITVSVQPTRESRKINGLDARRTNILARIPARNPKAPKANDIVVVNELWTTNVNGLGTTWDRVSAELDRYAGNASAFMPLMAQNPRVGAALQRTAQEAAKVHGLPVRRIVAYGLIPAGSKFQPGMPMDTTMSVVTDLTDVKNASLSLGLFEVPKGFTERRN